MLPLTDAVRDCFCLRLWADLLQRSWRFSNFSCARRLSSISLSDDNVIWHSSGAGTRSMEMLLHSKFVSWTLFPDCCIAQQVSFLKALCPGMP